MFELRSEAVAPAETPETLILRDCPNWGYLLQEFETLYRFCSVGGSKAIRAHRRRVRDTLSAIIDGNPEVAVGTPEAKPVTAHLRRAFDLGARNALAGLSRALERVSDQLVWEYGYKKVPPALARRYAFCHVLGPRGPVKSEKLILGFVLFAPNTTYPQHSHKYVEESYISVAGAWSENEMAVYAPGSLILNKPGQEHRTPPGISIPACWPGPGSGRATC